MDSLFKKIPDNVIKLTTANDIAFYDGYESENNIQKVFLCFWKKFMVNITRLHLFNKNYNKNGNILDIITI